MVKTQKALAKAKTTIGILLCKSLLSSMEYRWKEKIARRCWYLCSALDPRFKKMKFLPVSERGGVKRMVIEEVAELIATQRQDQRDAEAGFSVPRPTPTAVKPSFLDYGDDVEVEVDEEACVGPSPEEEASILVSRYFEEPASASAKDPMKYWSMSRARHSALATLALRMLPIQASSGSSERLFSSSGTFLTKRTASMADNTVEAVVFLRSLFQNHPKLWKALKSEAFATGVIKHTTR